MSLQTSMECLEEAVDGACELIDKLRAEKAKLREALADVRELIEPYMDVSDGPYGVPVANKAMRAVQRIDEVL